VNAKFICDVLSRKHWKDFFITECKNGPTQTVRHHLKFDALAVKKSWTNPRITIYEVKVSRSDFLRDKKHEQYLDYCNCFYFACPEGLIKKEELPDPRIGLVYIYDDKRAWTRKASQIRETVVPPISLYQYILYSRLEDDRALFWHNREEYLRQWVDGKISNRELGRRVNSKLINELTKLSDELSAKTSFDKCWNTDEKLNDYEKLKEILEEYGYPVIYKNKLSEIVRNILEKLNEKEGVNYVDKNC